MTLSTLVRFGTTTYRIQSIAYGMVQLEPCPRSTVGSVAVWVDADHPLLEVLEGVEGCKN